MRVLVTGGAGFIGSHLVDALIAKGHQVMILDDFSASSRKFVNRKAQVAKVNAHHFKKVAKVFKGFKPQAVFHLAAQVDIRSSLPKRARLAADSMNILRLSHLYGAAKLIFASSAAVYGRNTNLPLVESEPGRPIVPYGEAKANFERRLESYSQKFGFKAVSLRFSNVYGPRQGTVGEGGVAAIFCKRLLAGKPLAISGDGKQTRDFIFVDDVVRANLAALHCKKPYAVYNVSTQKATTINELTRRLIVVAGCKVAVKHAASVKGEVKHNVLSNRLIKKELGWSPKIFFEDGLRKTYQWFSENYK